MSVLSREYEGYFPAFWGGHQATVESSQSPNVLGSRPVLDADAQLAARAQSM